LIDIYSHKESSELLILMSMIGSQSISILEKGVLVQTTEDKLYIEEIVIYILIEIVKLHDFKL